MSVFTRRYLDPGSRLGEILFGLIMVLAATLTAGFKVAEGRAGVRQLLLTAIGCNIAWGIIDAVMYIMNSMIVRRSKVRLVEAVRKAPNVDVALGLIHDGIELASTRTSPARAARALWFTALPIAQDLSAF